MSHLQELMENPALWTYLVTLFGSTAMYVFTQSKKGFVGAKHFLKKMFPDRSEAFYFRTDFLLVVIFGSAIGFIVFSPHESLEALAAGFGWVGAMNTLLAANEKSV